MDRFIHLFSQKYHRFFHRGSQTGRSMIEMLGVLVVIGVLSVAALFGFTYAMNKYKANETIHDVMLRASNVPMIDEYYQIRPTNYAFKFPDLQDELSSMGYTMKTLKTDEFGYVYKVEAPSIPRRICSLILQMEPTDIDEIRIGSEKVLYTAGHSELCEEYKDSSTESTMMTFYFEKVCTTNADCNNKCQECYQGRCKANYDLPGCGEDGDPEGTTCPTAPVCGECEIKVYDAKGCHVGCQMTNCCPAPDCGPDDVFDEDSCSCVSGEEPTPDPGSGICNPPCDECHVCDEAIGQCVMKACEIESCPEGQEASDYDDCGCIAGCVEKCPDLVCDEECTIPNYETCSCDVDPDCCPEARQCGESCCNEGQVCGEDGTCVCPDEPTECGPCEELVVNPESGCKECQVIEGQEVCGTLCCDSETETCTDNGTVCCLKENVCGNTCCPTGVACNEEKGVCGCADDSDCCPENPCMHCVLNEELGVKECKMEGSLYETGSGGLACCLPPNRSYYGEFKPGGCDDVCFEEHPNEKMLCGQTYGVGNSCCASELSEETPSVSLCGSYCVSGSLGMPAISRDGNLSCCGFDSHVCPVKGLYALTGEMETLCCPKDAEPYYNQNNGSSLCCTDGKVSAVSGGKAGGVHCCPEGQTPYWNGSSVSCCNTSENSLVPNYVDGVGEAGYACCAKKDDYSETEDDRGLIRTTSETSYTVVGAVNGTCCGNFSTEETWESFENVHRKTNSVQRTYFINENNGVYYCGAETLNSVYQYSYPAILTSTITFHVFYTSPSKVCTIQTINDDKIDQGCKCSEVGNPSNGGEYCGSAL